MGNHRRQSRQILTKNEVFSGELVSVTLLLLLLVLEFVVEGEEVDGKADSDGVEDEDGFHVQIQNCKYTSVQFECSLTTATFSTDQFCICTWK